MRGAMQFSESIVNVVIFVVSFCRVDLAAIDSSLCSPEQANQIWDNDYVAFCLAFARGGGGPGRSPGAPFQNLVPITGPLGRLDRGSFRIHSHFRRALPNFESQIEHRILPHTQPYALA